MLFIPASVILAVSEQPSREKAQLALPDARARAKARAAGSAKRRSFLGGPRSEARSVPRKLGLSLVAVTTPLQKVSFTCWGVSGKPNLISTKKIKSKDPTQ